MCHVCWERFHYLTTATKEHNNNKAISFIITDHFSLFLNHTEFTIFYIHILDSNVACCVPIHNYMYAPIFIYYNLEGVWNVLLLQIVIN